MTLDMQTFTLIFTFLGVLVIGAVKAYERISGSNPESWDNAKFGMFFVVTIIVMGIEYGATGSAAFPADDLIVAFMAVLNPIFALFGTVYTTMIAGRFVKDKVIVPTVAAVSNGISVAKTPEVVGWSQGFTVTPTYKEGKSPMPVTLKIYATQVNPDHSGVTDVDIDWADGTFTNVPLKQGYGEVSHTYTFVADAHYTGHTFFPIFQFNGSDGTKTMFNVEGKGVEIWVQA